MRQTVYDEGVAEKVREDEFLRFERVFCSFMASGYIDNIMHVSAVYHVCTISVIR